MHEEVKEFFEAGRNFRLKHVDGNVLLIEQETFLKNVLIEWGRKYGNFVYTFSFINSINERLLQDIKCIIIDVDNQNMEDVKKLLKKIDTEYIHITSIVISSEKWKLDDICTKIMRVLSIKIEQNYNNLVHTLNQKMPLGIN